jgi:hypothetical protein
MNHNQDEVKQVTEKILNKDVIQDKDVNNHRTIQMNLPLENVDPNMIVLINPPSEKLKISWWNNKTINSS